MGAWSQRREDGVSVLTLTRPPVNALDRDSLDELADALRRVRHDPQTRVLVVTGGLAGIFCSGGDLKHWSAIRDGREVGGAGREAFALLRHLPQPTIAAINGQAIGDGLTLALACDLRMAAQAAMFHLPEAAYGFIPGWGLVGRLAATIGPGRAADLLLSGRTVDGVQALTLGLVNDVVPGERLMDVALGRGRQIAALSPAAHRAAKCALLGGDEARCFEAVWGGPDWHEGMEALRRKRTPAFAPPADGGGCCDLARGVPARRAPRG